MYFCIYTTYVCKFYICIYKHVYKHTCTHTIMYICVCIMQIVAPLNLLYHYIINIPHNLINNKIFLTFM